MDLLIGTVIGIFGAKSAPLRGSKYSENANFGHIVFFPDAIFSNQDPIMHCGMTSSPHLHTDFVVRECSKNVNSDVVREGGDQKNMKKTTKIRPSWKNHTLFEENPSISMSSKIFVRIHAVLTSLCQFIFLWTSSIVYVFDFLTFDIFLTIWHLFDNLTSFWHFDISFNLNHLSPSQGYFWWCFQIWRYSGYAKLFLCKTWKSWGRWGHWSFVYAHW